MKKKLNHNVYMYTGKSFATWCYVEQAWLTWGVFKLRIQSAL